MISLTLISLTQAMDSPIIANSASNRIQLTNPQLRRSQRYLLEITIKQLANHHELDFHELSNECKHFQQTYKRLPLIRETITIAANLKKQYIRQSELGLQIMSHLFNDNEDEIQSPKLDGYERADAIMAHLEI